MRPLSIGLFSPFIREPLHPRIESILTCVRRAGHTIELVPHDTRSRAYALASRATLSFFDPRNLASYLPRIRGYDVVWVQDLSLLPLVVAAKLAGKRVIYETLDHNVHWRLHRARKQFPLLGRAHRLGPVLEGLEVSVANRYADQIFVNSEMLARYLGPRARVLYYCSHLESLAPLHDATRSPALLYLGLFNEDKGAWDVLELARERALPLYLFGTVADARLRDAIATNPRIVYRPRLRSDALREGLREALEQHALLGLSLVRGVHKSYELGEHNKDIDYLAIGAPILGNERGPTREKIAAGCGALLADAPAVERLLGDASARYEARANALAYYARRYARALYERQLLEALEAL